MGRYFETAAKLGDAVDVALPLLGAIPGAGKAIADRLREISGLAEHAASGLDRGDKAFEQVQNDVRSEFQQLKRKLLVVIDDIDRLTDEEIRLIFRLAKATADFPNTVYLLLFQKETVTRALNKICGGKGEEFLKKIVQVDLGLPHLPAQKIASYWEQGVEEILGSEITEDGV